MCASGKKPYPNGASRRRNAKCEAFRDKRVSLRMIDAFADA